MLKLPALIIGLGLMASGISPNNPALWIPGGLLFCAGLFFFKWDFGGMARTRGFHVVPPPFKACKRTGKIMNGLWYGRITPDMARQMAIDWEFPEEGIEGMILDATGQGSYWWHVNQQEQEAEQDAPADAKRPRRRA